jgi:hypothetical protein
MKWTREQPGVYISGKWRVEGEGTDWELFEGKKKRHKARSKKECQQVAEAAEEDVDGHHEPDDPLPTTFVDPKPSKLALDGVLASLRLDIDHLSHRISSLDDSNRKLTEAILILGKHVAKLNKGN